MIDINLYDVNKLGLIDKIWTKVKYLYTNENHSFNKQIFTLHMGILFSSNGESPFVNNVSVYLYDD